MAFPPTDFAPAAEFLPALLDLLPTGVVGYQPIFSPGGAIEDFSFEYLNPAAQRMMGLSTKPTKTHAQLFPNTLTKSRLDFLRAAFAADEPRHTGVHFTSDAQHDYSFQVSARRLGDKLLVTFADTAVEETLRASEAREQAARAEAERQRAQLHNVFEQAPAMICIFDGPQHCFQFVNPPYQALVGDRPLLGLPIAEAMPELAGQPIFDLLDQVYRTGEPFFATDMLVQLDHENANPSELEKRYYNFTYQARRGLSGQIDGILSFAYEVTPQVQARRELQVLNEELEARVAERTQETQQALSEAQAQREQLRGQQNLLQQILGQVPAAVATLTGPEHRFSFANEQYQALVTDRAVLGLKAAEALPEVVEQGFIDLLDGVYTTGQPFVGTEMSLQLDDHQTGQQSLQYVDFIYQPLTDAAGQTQGILAFIVDTTERVMARQKSEALQAQLLASAERQASEREELYQVFEQAPVVIALLRGTEHYFHYCNPAFQALFPLRTLAGQLYADAMPEMVAAGLMPELDRVYATGQPYFGNALPVVTMAPGGSSSAPHQRYFDFSYHPYREDGRIAGVSIFGYDVTEQVLARREREAQQQELYRIFEQAPVAITVMRGPELTVELANASISAIWGRPASQTLGRPYFEAVPDTAGQGFEEILDNVLRTGTPFFMNERPVTLDRAHTNQPELGYFNFIFQSLRDARQHPVGVVAIGTEVTDQVLARQQVQALNEELAAINEEMQATNEELNHSNNRLSRTNADLDTFVYSASHDLKSPITNIEGLLLALRQQLPPEALQADLVPRLLELMEDSVGRFQQTLDHLTDVSRLQQFHLDQPTEAVDLAELVESVRLDIMPELTAAQATLRLTIEDCPTIYFPAKNLRSILYNLLSNAVKYRAPGRPAEVALRCRAAGPSVTLEVQDNGLGLSTAQQGELFRLFRRLHDHVPGSGVGLYMVKKMVENADGMLRVQSELGVGSTFTVILPSPTARP